MLRFYVFNQLIKEAHAIDFYTEKQARDRRDMELFTSSKEYLNNYRLSEELMNQMLEDIKHLLKPAQRRRRALSSKIKLLCALSFFAHGSYQKLCKRNLSQPSVSRCIHAVVEALNHHSIIKKYITFPQNYQERLTLKERFYEKYKIPGVIGCIDRTFVTMVRPSKNEERFCCWKGYHAINVQLITDADFNILHVDATNGGATPDNFIFNKSIQEHLQKLTDTDEMVHLLGDSGYTLRPYLMVPVPETEDGSPAHHYNKIHAKARNTVKLAIGLLKARFRCLLVNKVLHYDPDRVTKIVIACCVLHNICNRAGLPAPTIDTCDQRQENLFHTGMLSREVPKYSDAIESAMGESRRQDLINNLWWARNIV